MAEYPEAFMLAVIKNSFVFKEFFITGYEILLGIIYRDKSQLCNNFLSFS